MEHADADPLGARRGLSAVITGAGGQLGHALADAFPEARALTREDWDVTFPAPEGLDADLVLHAAAWTNVDGAEDDPQSAAAVNVGGTLNVASLEVPLVAWSSDYVFDGTKRTPYLESDSPAPLGAYGRTKLHGGLAHRERRRIGGRVHAPHLAEHRRHLGEAAQDPILVLQHALRLFDRDVGQRGGIGQRGRAPGAAS